MLALALEVSFSLGVVSDVWVDNVERERVRDFLFWFLVRVFS